MLAPGGVPAISVSYWAFAGPALLWVGAGLFALRLADVALERGRPILAKLLRPICGPLAPTVAAGLSRQRSGISRAVMLVALPTSLAAAPALFHARSPHPAHAATVPNNSSPTTGTSALT